MSLARSIATNEVLCRAPIAKSTLTDSLIVHLDATHYADLASRNSVVRVYTKFSNQNSPETPNRRNTREARNSKAHLRLYALRPAGPMEKIPTLSYIGKQTVPWFQTVTITSAPPSTTTRHSNPQKPGIVGTIVTFDPQGYKQASSQSCVSHQHQLKGAFPDLK